MVDSVVSCKRGPLFSEDGVYVVTMASGAVRHIYRDPCRSMIWCDSDVSSTEPYGSDFLGFTKAEALVRLCGVPRNG